MSEFDDDVAVVAAGDGRWTATPTDRWNIGVVPDGGYTLAIGLNAISQAMSHPDPVTVTGHFLGKVVPNQPVEIEVDVIKAGKRFSTASAAMFQDGTERLRMLATFGDLDAVEGPTAVTGERPDIPTPEQCVEANPNKAPVEIARRFTILVPQEMEPLLRFQPTGVPELHAYMKFRDGREPDLLSLALYADALPPPAYNVAPMGWVPTLELTVHFRGKPEPGLLQLAFRTRYLISGLMEEDGEIWDSRGNLVALSRQIALNTGVVEL